MITRDNAHKYSAFFAELNEVMLPIYGEFNADTNLNGWTQVVDINNYFTQLEKIAEQVMAEKIDNKFLIMPQFDEGLFEIDANSRKITVPTDFQKNGVAVKEDEMAETLYFSIDRYYDLADLAEKEIFVQWIANKKQGLTHIINKTLMMKPGKLIFGWPITSEVTSEAGNIEFTIRFYEKVGEELEYSLSTLPATVKVNNSLAPKFDLTDDEFLESIVTVDKVNRFYALLRNSQAVGVDIPAEKASFDWAAFWPIVEENGENPYLGDLVDILDADGKPRILGRAYFDESTSTEGRGLISYKWNYSVKETADSDDDKSFINEPIYKEFAGSSLNPGDLYFTKSGENYTVYGDSTLPADGTQLYQLYASCVPTKAGAYDLIAVNTAGMAGNFEKVRTVGRWVILYPLVPDAKGYVEGEELIAVPVILNDEKNATITVDAEAKDEVKEHTTLSYVWRFKAEEKELAILPTNGEGEEVSEVADLILVGGDEPDAIEGYYQLAVRASKNEAISEPAYSKWYRVTELVTEPILTYKVNDGAELVDDDVIVKEDGYEVSVGSGAAKLEVIVDESVKHDKFTYAWYSKTSTADPVLQPVTGPIFNIPLKTRTNFAGQKIYCEVTNHRNGKTKMKRSILFDIKL